MARRVSPLLSLLLLLLALPLGAQEQGESVLLIANPDHHPHGVFHHSVVVARRHGERGSVGIIINRPSEHLLEEVLTELPALKGSGKRLYRGGPVSPRMLVYLYRDDTPRPDALPIGDGYFLTFNPSSIEDLLKEKTTLSQIRIFNGYTGWAEGQLQQEIGRGSWHVLPLQGDILMSEQPEKLWQRLIRPFTGDWVEAPNAVKRGRG